MVRLFILLFLSIAQVSLGQKTTLSVHTTKDNYIYIPKNISEVFKELDKSMDISEKMIVKVFQEDSAVVNLWKLGPPDFLYDWKLAGPKSISIVSYFNNLGISQPYDFTRTIIISYHRYLNNKPIELRKTIETIKKERNQEYKTYSAKLTKDTINGFYIPKDLKDCFLQLDKILLTKDKQEIKTLKTREETLNYHHSLGLWMRNNWGLWGGSRLQTYLFNHGCSQPDDMSSTILEYYYDWLNNRNDEWLKWNNKSKHLKKTKQK